MDEPVICFRSDGQVVTAGIPDNATSVIIDRQTFGQLVELVNRMAKEEAARVAREEASEEEGRAIAAFGGKYDYAVGDDDWCYELAEEEDA